MSTDEELDKKRELFDKYDKQIDEIYTFRDKFFILNEDSISIEDRNRELIERLNNLVLQLESIGETQFESKASFLVLIGKAYNVLPDFNQKACDSLTKAIKLDPKSFDAWNYLGESYWKKRDFDMCRNCFEQSLSIKKNKKSLRGMSMVMRQLINTPLDKEKILNQTQQQQQMAKYDHIKNSMEESIRYAKESLEMDAKDGMSWYILANCYVAKFFSPFGAQNSILLKQAITAYNLALKDESVACLQSDLYFNKSMISIYEENWQDVLVSLCKALQLDPWWSEARENLKGALNYLTQINDMIANKGKLKTKKFNQLIESLKQKTDLGPYSQDYQATIVQNGQEKQSSLNIDLIEVNLNDLKKGLNSNKVLLGKVICGMPTTDNFNTVCFTCCITDSKGECAALTIYNLAAGNGLIIGQSVAIPEPYIENVEFNFKLDDFLKNKELVKLVSSSNMNFDFEFKFKSIRVENPTVCVVNGKKWTKDKVSSAFFVPTVIAD